jgi:hypothetical protein
MVRPVYRTNPRVSDGPIELRAVLLAALGCLALACTGDPSGQKQPPAGGGAAQGKAVEGKAADGKAVEGKAAAKSPVLLKHDDGQPLGKVLDDAPLPLVKLLGQTPQEAEQHLGPPLPDSKGGMRDSCVRYLPERTWFRCKFAWQRYSDATGTFGAVHVTYEDGKVSGLSFEKIPGEGPFDPRQALLEVGLELPGEPKVETPEKDVSTWSWWNTVARLVVYGRQYRVRVSAVKGTWESAKVEIILNDALNESEKARVFDPAAENGGLLPADERGGP